jgi:hypothetical protein
MFDVLVPFVTSLSILRWYLVSLQFGMGAALGGHASLANPRVRATSDLESIVATLLGFLGGVLWLYALAEGVSES